MKLYHGSYLDINEIDLDKCKPGKDFGKGFYLNPNFEQARVMAERVSRLLQDGNPVVNAFCFDEAVLSDAF